MDRNALISIIIPIFNSEKYLNNLISDVKNQTFSDFECILINDGSTDSSSDICHFFAKQDKRFRVIDKENEGVSKTRNRGLKEAVGDYIAFIDSDDRISKHYLEYLKAGIDKGADVSSCGHKFVRNNNPHITNGVFSPRIKVSGGGYATFFTEIESGFLGGNFLWGHLYKSEIIESLYFQDTLSEDLFFNSLVVPKIKKIAFVDKKLYYYHVHSGSLCQNKKNLTRGIIDVLNCFVSISKTKPIGFEELSPFLFQQISGYSVFIFMYKLHTIPQFTSEYVKLIPYLDEYYGYWKKYKKNLHWFIYKVFWGFCYKFTKRIVIKKNSKFCKCLKQKT